MRGENERARSTARRLRQGGNDSEDALWSELRDRRLNGFKFVRQLPIGPYFADFACREQKLVVELNGSQHAQSQRDEMRDQYMISEGWSVLRFWNVDALKERQALLETILAALEERSDRWVDAPDLRFKAAAEYGAKC